MSSRTARRPTVRALGALSASLLAAGTAAAVALPDPLPVHHGRSVLRSAVGAGPTSALGAVVVLPFRSTPDHRPAGRADPVGRLRGLRPTTVLVSSPRPLPPRVVARIRAAAGVQAVLSVDLGWTRISRYKVETLGVDPARFRAWTPAVDARSRPLWERVATGDLVVSFDFGRQGRIPLGGRVRVRRAGRMRVGAYATMGIPGVDAVVGTPAARTLGLPRGNALLVSAPRLSTEQLQQELVPSLPSGVRTEPVAADYSTVTDPGEWLTRGELDAVLSAALSRLGAPYVWGGSGPGEFDCSGLVQWSFARAGILLPRTAAEQFLSGVHIPLADALPGDLLFWHYDPTDPGYVDHVAIYLGDGRMVVAAHTGTRVAVEPVPLADLAGVVRIRPVPAG